MPQPSFKIPYLIENLIPREELIKLRDLSIRRFYFCPRYIFKELVKVRTAGEFLRKLKMAVGLMNVLRGVFKR